MSEPEAPNASPGASAGELLREARERAGFSLETLSEQLKVTPRRIELLEANRLDQLPDVVFVRALAQSMCRHLKIDPGPVLAMLPQPRGARLEEIHVGLNAPFRQGTAQAATADSEGLLGRPMVWGAALVVLAALAFYFVPSEWLAPPKVSSRPAVPTPAVEARREAAAPQVESPAAAAAPAPGAVPESSSVAPRALDVAPAAAPARPAVSPTAPAAAAASTPAPAPAVARATQATPEPSSAAGLLRPTAEGAKPVPALPQPLPAGNVVAFRVSEATWVEVQDAQGKLIVARELRAGETLGVNGETPFKVVVGNAGAAQVALRGKPIDLRSFTRDNVARFELQ